MKRTFEEKIGLQGLVRIYVDGELRWEGSNLVTNAGLAYNAILLGGLAAIILPGATSYETIDTIRIGNGGSVHLVTDPTVPNPPQRADTALYAEIIPAPVLSQNVAVSVASNTVTFTAAVFSDNFTNSDFPNTDGAVIPQTLFVNEAGLYVNAPETSVQVLFARVTFPSIQFAPTSGTTLTIEWIVGSL